MTALLAVPVLLACASDTPPGVRPDDVAAARAALAMARETARSANDRPLPERIRQMTRLGLWDEADSLLRSAVTTNANPDLLAAEGELRFRQMRFPAAESLAAAALSAAPSHRNARLLRALLHGKAWEFPEARAEAEALLADDGRDIDAGVLLGRISLLEKRYDDALARARQLQGVDRASAAAHALEADVHLWNLDDQAAEAALRRALELDPFDPDARFKYGYVVWRKVDATLLDEMAAQWNLTLDIHPLHHFTHWHFGNGYTNLTYADYAHATDSVVRERLRPADIAISEGRIADAARMTRDVDAAYPESVLPALYRGSAYHLAHEWDVYERLDSAEATFRSILDRKPNYGPAHNGLAAILAARQSAYLATYDSLEAAIASVELPATPHFTNVFVDIDYYPGDRVKKMVYEQLGPGRALLPLIERYGGTYVIPPIHRELAEALRRPALRYNVTFDNVQWMDIRGSGAGAASIEYVERGAFAEREVVAHEFAHQFHGRILSDEENRRIRELYFAAMDGGYVLDYYAANNENEYFAQAYEAYINPLKVHPLEFNSMNTHHDLAMKDPAALRFLDALADRAARSEAGDSTALASNWAQLHVALAERARTEGDLPVARAQVDTALLHDSEYRPAHLAYASLEAASGLFEEADRRLDGLAALDSTYAPVLAVRAEVAAARARADELTEGAAFDMRAALLRDALAMETDLLLRAEHAAALRELYRAHARIGEALAAADEYGRNGPIISTRLRDARVQAIAFAAELRGLAGYGDDALPILADLVAQRPQDITLRMQYADVLVANDALEAAERTIEETRRILVAAGEPRADLTVRLAAIRLQRGDQPGALELVQPLLSPERASPADPLLARVLAALGEHEGAREIQQRLPPPESPAERAEALFTDAWLAEHAGSADASVAGYLAALEENPFHYDARVRLVTLLSQRGDADGAAHAASAARDLALPPGPGVERALAAAQR